VESFKTQAKLHILSLHPVIARSSSETPGVLGGRKQKAALHAGGLPPWAPRKKNCKQVAVWRGTDALRAIVPRVQSSAETKTSPEERIFEPVRSTRSFETAIVRILDGVERARLRRGDRLPSERRLSAELEISVPTLRQALVVLQRAGVVDVRPGKTGGIFLISELIPTEAISQAVALEESAAIDVLKGRRVLEPAVAAYAMRVASASDYAELERTVTLLGTHVGERAQVMRADAMFHRALVRACHNRTLEAAMHSIARGLAPIRDAYSGGIDTDRESLSIHTSQLETMQEGDPEALAAILDRHLRMLEEAFSVAIGRSWDELFGQSVSGRYELAQISTT
jgi:GntR family transcriptional repressor for pyruvate dehydrogenase complex